MDYTAEHLRYARGRVEDIQTLLDMFAVLRRRYGTKKEFNKSEEAARRLLNELLAELHRVEALAGMKSREAA